jgi:hypothetical protein
MTSWRQMVSSSAPPRSAAGPGPGRVFPQRRAPSRASSDPKYRPRDGLLQSPRSGHVPVVRLRDDLLGGCHRERPVGGGAAGSACRRGDQAALDLWKAELGLAARLSLSLAPSFDRLGSGLVLNNRTEVR